MRSYFQGILMKFRRKKIMTYDDENSSDYDDNYDNNKLENYDDWQMTYFFGHYPFESGLHKSYNLFKFPSYMYFSYKL